MTRITTVKCVDIINVDRHNRILMGSDGSVSANGFVEVKEDRNVSKIELTEYLMNAFDHVENSDDMQGDIGDALNGRHGVRSLSFWNAPNIEFVMYSMDSGIEDETAWAEIRFTAFYTDSNEKTSEKRSVECYVSDSGKYVTEIG